MKIINTRTTIKRLPSDIAAGTVFTWGQGGYTYMATGAGKAVCLNDGVLLTFTNMSHGTVDDLRTVEAELHVKD